MATCKLAVTTLGTPIGRVLIKACSAGVHEINLTETTELNNNNSVVMIIDGKNDSNDVMAATVNWLKTYFTDLPKARKMSLPALHLPDKNPDSFHYKVWMTLQNDVPCGETVTYGKLAELSGNAKASRAVGGAMRTNPTPLIVPCHRVTKSDGTLGKYMSGKGDVIKRWLLEHEGAQV
ncbi:methylated-DNA--protein-cysteine methyltransferase-like [Anneissia japonica]|uniref:methylated-DNA--protein-cysteine methyltransferase-like n=1 Tax=Anneissia japonica TaxID=1529436 RepID=UPI001425A6F7|nr:methylated-DNA--protein-cysteine methyltransferase-like [Anneissia japonica]XP_033098424.1 methylated-DNA--protein-cysteine methyltransferase-like [Anneissia japonica]XP_033098425.1 methylated-DNA--protein-cysteine methyltransferase-like [Anneissia japonica]